MDSKKIDLHIHTNCSDGDETAINILKKAQELKLSYISITDHENCIAYETLEDLNISELYNGTLITGCELMTSHQGTMIEILGYGVDYKVINKWYRKEYSKEAIESRDKRLFHNLIEKIEKSNIKISPNLNLPREIPYSGYFKYLVYNDIVKYQENDMFLRKHDINNYEQFIRRGLSNKKSEIFIDEGKEIATLKEIIDLIHKAGGLAFIAHVFKYNLDDHMQFLRNLIPYGIDGVECYYSSFSKEQTEKLETFCNQYSLYKSGGSDYHGTLKPNINIGIGTEGEFINKEIIDKWIDQI